MSKAGMKLCISHEKHCCELAKALVLNWSQFLLAKHFFIEVLQFLKTLIYFQCKSTLVIEIT